MSKMSGVLPLFVMNKRLPAFEKKEFSTTEICRSVEKMCGYKTAEGAQRIGGLWRLYLANNEAREKLLIEGMALRGVQISVNDKNPFLVRNIDGVFREVPTTRLIISNVPLSFSDEEIMSAIKALPNVDTRSELFIEKARDENYQLTHWKTGRRFLFISVPDEPLPRSMEIGGFKARLYHKEQKGLGQSDQNITCKKCLEKGHKAAQCQNPITCKQCYESGHKAGDPVCKLNPHPYDVPASSDSDSNDESAADQRDDNTQAEHKSRGRKQSRAMRNKLKVFRHRDRSDSIKRKSSRSPRSDKQSAPSEKVARRQPESESLQMNGGGGDSLDLSKFNVNTPHVASGGNDPPRPPPC